MPSLRHATLKGTLWSVVQQVGDRGVRLPVLLILAHLLPPQSFGLVALAGVCIEFTDLFLNQGLALAIVQRQRLEREHLDSAFWGNIAFALLLGTAVFAAAGPLASLLREPAIEPIVRVLSLGFLFTALSAVQEAKLLREMRFKVLALRSFVGNTTGSLVGIALALAGFGVWSLVAMQLTVQAAGVVLLWSASGWRPRLRFSFRHYRELFAFGVSILGISLMDFFRGRADTFLVGSVLGAATLGYYTVAKNVINGVSAFVNGSVSPVLVSAMSRLQTEPARLEKAVYQSAEVLAFIGWPAFLGIAAVAPELVSTVLGDRWLPSVPILQAFAVGAVVRGTRMVSFIAITSIGKPAWRVWLEAVAAVVMVAAILVALPHGVVAVAWATTAATYLVLPLQLWVFARLVPVSIRAFARRHVSTLLGAAPMILCVIGLRALAEGHLPTPWLLALLVATGVLVYAALMWLAAPGITRRALASLQLAVGRSDDADASVATPDSDGL